MKTVRTNKTVIAAFAVILAMVSAMGAFAQRVGDTVQVSGANWTVQSVSGDTMTLRKAAGYQVGDRGPGGGIIFYVNTAGFTVEMPNARDNYTANYLEVAPANAGTNIQWGGTGTISGITSTSSATSQELTKIGNGRKDTALIVAALQGKETNRAAQLASAYTNNGLRDWFLPSAGELNELYNQRNLPGINMTSGTFWSSTQGGAGTVLTWHQIFSANSNSRTSVNRGTANNVRAIRAF